MTDAKAYASLAAARRVAGGCSEREAVWESGKLTLYRYRPIARPAAGGVPLLIVYALVNRPYMMDLQEDRSLIRGLLAAGLDVISSIGVIPTVPIGSRQWPITSTGISRTASSASCRGTGWPPSTSSASARAGCSPVL